MVAFYHYIIFVQNYMLEDLPYIRSVRGVRAACGYSFWVLRASQSVFVGGHHSPWSLETGPFLHVGEVGVIAVGCLLTLLLFLCLAPFFLGSSLVTGF